MVRSTHILTLSAILVACQPGVRHDGHPAGPASMPPPDPSPPSESPPASSRGPAANDAPTARITSPSDGERFLRLEPVLLEGRVTPDQDPRSTEITWTSTLDGPLDLGAPDPKGLFSSLHALSVGTHTLSLVATDDLGQQSADQVTIEVSCASEAPDQVFASCATAYAAGHLQDGTYEIDPDGDGPASARCDFCRMRSGGGWTLVAHHADGIDERVFRDVVTPEETGVMTDDAWWSVRDDLTEGLLIRDEHGEESQLSLASLEADGLCSSVDGVDTLAGRDALRLWHAEDAGCDVRGGDYSLLQLSGSDYASHHNAGAALWQRAALGFDAWPYGDTESSLADQDVLLVFAR